VTLSCQVNPFGQAMLRHYGERIHPIAMIFRCGTRDSQLTRRNAV